MKLKKKWITRFLDLAHVVASWSKDPSTKVGAVVSKGKKVISLGFNGPPAKVKDLKRISREKKLYRTIHAEPNAILTACKNLKGCTITVTHLPCPQCAAMIIQSKVKRVICPEPSADYMSRWADSVKESLEMFQEAKVKVKIVKKYKFSRQLF